MKRKLIFLIAVFMTLGAGITYSVSKNIHASSRPSTMYIVDRECEDWRSRYRMNHVTKCKLENRDKSRDTREYKSDILRNQRPKPTYTSRARRLQPMRSSISPRIKRTTTQKDYYSHIGLRSSSVKSDRRTAMRSRGYSTQLRTSSTKNYKSHYQWKKRQ